MFRTANQTSFFLSDGCDCRSRLLSIAAREACLPRPSQYHQETIPGGRPRPTRVDREAPTDEVNDPVAPKVPWRASDFLPTLIGPPLSSRSKGLVTGALLSLRVGHGVHVAIRLCSPPLPFLCFLHCPFQTLYNTSETKRIPNVCNN